MKMTERIYWHAKFPVYMRELLGRNLRPMNRLADEIAASVGCTRAAVHMTAMNRMTQRSR